MRICLFTETYSPEMGGGETQARLLVDGLAARGAEVFLLTRRSRRELPVRERVAGHLVVRLSPSGRGPLKKWGLVGTGLIALFRLRGRYDLVFVSGFRIVGIAAVLAGGALGKRVVLKADSQGEMSGRFFAAGLKRVGLRVDSPGFRAFLALRNRLLRRADAFVAITDDVAAELSDAGVPATAIHAIPNGVDTERFAPVSPERKRALRAQLGLPATSPIAVYTGRLVSYKGLPLLVRVWADLARVRPDARLVLVGSGGLDIHSCESELHALAAQLGIADRVVFTGSVGNVPEYLQAADLFVFPTENDAFPSSLVEAMACGLPVLTTPVGAIPRVVSDGENGLLVPPGDGPALAAALERLLDDAPLSARLARMALVSARAHYSADQVTLRYAELFERLLAQPQDREVVGS